MIPMAITDESISNAEKIAKAIGKGRFRKEVVADAHLALVEAEAAGMSKDEAEKLIRTRCRTALRRQWGYENRISSTAPRGGVPTLNHVDLWEALKALPPRQHRAVVLHFWEGLRCSEIAAEMLCSEKAAQNLIGRALATLKNILPEQRGFLPFSLRKVNESDIQISDFQRHYSEETQRSMPMKLLTLSEVAQRLSVSPQTIRRHFKGQLPGGVRVGRRIKYTEDAIADFIRGGGCLPMEQDAPEVRASA